MRLAPAPAKPAYGLTSDRREAAALERILRGCASTAMAPMVCRSATTSVRRNTRGTGGDDDALVRYDDDATAGSRARRHADTGSRPCTARTRRWHRGPGTVPGLAPVPRPRRPCRQAMRLPFSLGNSGGTAPRARTGRVGPRCSQRYVGSTGAEAGLCPRFCAMARRACQSARSCSVQSSGMGAETIS